MIRKIQHSTIQQPGAFAGMADSCGIHIRWGPVLKVPLVPLDATVFLPFFAHLCIYIIPVVVEDLLEIIWSIVDPWKSKKM